MPRLFLLEDDASLAEGLAWALGKQGFEVSCAATLAQARAWPGGMAGFDILVLDVGLPDGSGFTFCESLRAAGCNTPILFLTAAEEEVNIIRGLDGGGDDYMTKPFQLRALLRRAGGSPAGQTVLRSGEICIDLAACRVTRGGKLLELTAAEYRLLCLLVRNAGRTLTRRAILDALWDGSGDFVDDNTLSVYVRRLRAKIEDDPAHPRRLITVRGFGYRWEGQA